MGNLVQQLFEAIRQRTVQAFLIGSADYVIVRVFHKATVPYARRMIRGSMDGVEDVGRIVDFTFFFKRVGISIKPLQVRDEVAELLNLVNRLKPRIILEIGTAAGGTLFMLARVADQQAKIISIDLPGGSFGGGYPKCKASLYRSFAMDEQRIYLIRANSHHVDTLKEVEKLLDGHEADFLFVDGDHTYEGVKWDFEMYSPLVKKGGIIAFHDVLPHDKLHDPSGEVGVDIFWRELKKNHKCVEIVKNRRQGWAGIGILYA